MAMIGITRSHIKEAVEYVFEQNDKPAEKRVIKFKGGKEAVDNILPQSLKKK
jgi:hypothetical protein